MFQSYFIINLFFESMILEVQDMNAQCKVLNKKGSVTSAASFESCELGFEN